MKEKSRTTYELVIYTISWGLIVGAWLMVLPFALGLREVGASFWLMGFVVSVALLLVASDEMHKE